MVPWKMQMAMPWSARIRRRFKILPTETTICCRHWVPQPREQGIWHRLRRRWIWATRFEPKSLGGMESRYATMFRPQML